MKISATLSCGFVLAIASVACGYEPVTVSKQGQPKRDVITRRLTTPEDWSPRQWDWCGQTLVAWEGEWESPVVEVLRIGQSRIDRSGQEAFHRAHHPLLLDERTIVFVRDNRFTTASLDNRKVLAESKPLEGYVGETRIWAGMIWTYTLSEHSHDAELRMYRIDPRTGETLHFGTGYHPFTMTGDDLYFVDRETDYSLFVAPLIDGKPDFDRRHRVFGSDAYAPSIAPQAGLIVCQRGYEQPKIELLNKDGVLQRCLSGDGRPSYYPFFSPSGKFIAYAYSGNSDWRAQVLEVVDQQGELVHQALIGSYPIGGAYVWERGKDRLATMTRMGDGPIVVEIATFEDAADESESDDAASSADGVADVEKP